jgi:hypothetical protein
VDLDKPVETETRGRAAKPPHGLGELLHKLLFSSHSGLSRKEFLCDAARNLLEYSGCDVVEIRIATGTTMDACLVWLNSAGAIECDSVLSAGTDSALLPDRVRLAIPESIYESVTNRCCTVTSGLPLLS